MALNGKVEAERVWTKAYQRAVAAEPQLRCELIPVAHTLDWHRFEVSLAANAFNK